MKIIPWLLLGSITFDTTAQPIDREALVKRHTIVITKVDSLSSLSLGNGGFAFTADVTGLQSFPLSYQHGVPLGTESAWGWHSFPNRENYKPEEALKVYELNGKKISYSVQWKTPDRNKNASDYFRINPHRLQLGNIGLEILKKNGEPASITDIKDIRQKLDLWTGELSSSFTVDETPVSVTTYVHQQQDLVAVKVVSPLIGQKRLKIRIRFPYPTGDFKDLGTDYSLADRHISVIEQKDEQGALISHTLDTTRYYLQAHWQQEASIQQYQPHYFLISPEAGNSFEAEFLFSGDAGNKALPSFEETMRWNQIHWPQFWKSGGAVDLSGSTDPRAKELERRIVLSQYLERIQCAASYPPQETGLTYNSWYGKPHLEMHWWHAAHFALWGRPELMEKSLDWYFTAIKEAKFIAQRQGFDGVRWQKMTDPAGDESPSSVGAFLIWQQPHLIYMAELLYRENHDKKVLEKYQDLVFATADFMASFPTWDSAYKRYNLGKGLIPAQESFDAVTTYNPAYELNYWRWALNIAKQWKERLGLPKQKKWDEVTKQLAKLPEGEQDGKKIYLTTESNPDCYTNEKYIRDHPEVLAAFASIPGDQYVDSAIMKNTFDLVWKVWNWKDTWGWDFPMTAMTATRLHMPEKAIEALFMPVQKNTYLVNGHNFQDGRLTIYLPGNGGLLSAIAMMCAGYDGCREINPGFPKNGKWVVKWEGLQKIF